METDITQRPDAIFRPIKRRKFLRKRLDGRAEDVTSEQNNTSIQHDSQKEKTVAEQLSLMLSDDGRNGEPQPAGPLHLRKPHRVRRGGIEFFSAKQKADGNRQSSGMTLEDMESENIEAMFDRFTAHTGQKVDLDKHMYDLVFFI